MFFFGFLVSVQGFELFPNNFISFVTRVSLFKLNCGLFSLLKQTRLLVGETLSGFGSVFQTFTGLHGGFRRASVFRMFFKQFVNVSLFEG